MSLYCSDLERNVRRRDGPWRDFVIFVWVPGL